jgi:hypothetical protein
VSPQTVWVRIEWDGEQWHLLGVYDTPDDVIKKESGWEPQGRDSFARLRDDGWFEWLQPSPYHPAEPGRQSFAPSEEVEPDVPSPAPSRSPWARPSVA